ncbi:hypothetical protein BC835DRAFT_1310325 [Cytidiella melzeri]|nr:hypothetical protein BC835DRAFT_1310325 [Cytidiella melzeri]
MELPTPFRSSSTAVTLLCCLLRTADRALPDAYYLAGSGHTPKRAFSPPELSLFMKQLQSSSTEQEIITSNTQDYPHITEPVLRESKAGLAVGKLHSHASKQVADQAKDLVKKWQQTVEQAKLQNGKGSASSGRNAEVLTRRTSGGQSIGEIDSCWYHCPYV